jgi:hypothetical protein
MFCRKYFLQKELIFSQGNHVFGAAVSNVDGFLWRDTCLSSTHLTSLFGDKRAYLRLETP